MTARQAARGRLAHQMCSVEMWPWRMDFSRRAWAEIRLIGRSTSISRFGYSVMVFGSLLLGIIEDGLLLHLVVLDLDDRLPAEPRRVLNDMKLRRSTRS